MSLLIHTVLAVAIFFSYKAISSYAEDKEHPCECCSTTINLNTIQTSKPKPPVVVKQPVKKNKTKMGKPVKNGVKKHTVKKEVATKKPESKKVMPAEEPLQTPVAVKEDSNATQQTIHNKVEKDIDTHCETKIIAKEEPKEKHDDYLSLHLDEIVALLKENLYYPRRARKRAIEGVVIVKFTLSKDAKISNVKVVKSDYEILSRAARETIENLEDKLPKPDEELTLKVPINYDLK